MPRREDHIVHKDMWGIGEGNKKKKKKRVLYIFPIYCT